MAFWKVKGFQPNEVVTRGNVTIYADEKGRLKRVVEGANPNAIGRIAKNDLPVKDNIAYYDDEHDPGFIYKNVIDSDEYPRIWRELDWVHFADGVTCQILRTYHNFIPSKKGDPPREQVIIQTMFGTNSVFANAPINMIYDRESFGKLRRHLIFRNKLTSRESLLVVRYIEADFDLQKTYQLHYKRPPEAWEANKYNFAAKLREAMYSDIGMKLFAEVFCRRFKTDMTFEEWRNKIVKSVPDTLTKPFHLDMWMILGKLEPEVRKRLMEAEGAKEEGEERGGFLPPKPDGGVQDAEYQDICKVCGGTQVVKTTTTSGLEVEVKCPACKNGSVPVSGEVQKRSIELRV